MNENNAKKNVQASKNETHAAETHAPWQLEKDTEGLDAPKKSATSGSEESKEGKESKKESSEGCGCKYF